MSEKIVMKHPDLGDERVTVTPRQFEIWKESGWVEDKPETTKVNKEAEAKADKSE